MVDGMKTDPPRWPGPLPGPCVCTLLRRVTRAVTSHYDQALAAYGLTVTQYALLVHIGRSEQPSRTGLAATMGMDRTTLTRTLAPLERQRWVSSAASKDRRERLLSLTLAGRAKVAEAYPGWEATQKQLVEQLGTEPWATLRTLLEQTQQAAQNIPE